jgi:hypothetical protein
MALSSNVHAAQNAQLTSRFDRPNGFLWSFARILSGDCSKMLRIDVEDTSIAYLRGNAWRVRVCFAGSITDLNIHEAT